MIINYFKKKVEEELYDGFQSSYISNSRKGNDSSKTTKYNMNSKNLRRMLEEVPHQLATMGKFEELCEFLGDIDLWGNIFGQSLSHVVSTPTSSAASTASSLLLMDYFRYWRICKNARKNPSDQFFLHAEKHLQNLVRIF